MKQAYRGHIFRRATLKLIEQANAIIEGYAKQGYVLTVRQLYYQLVARDLIPNTLQSYKVVVSALTDGREAGLIDWDMIEDCTREVATRASWPSGKSVLHSAAEGFHMDRWEGQETLPLVVVEKEALAGVMQRICFSLDVPFLAARGYPSATVLRDVTIGRIEHAVNVNGQTVKVLHFGDHDPSGIDMTRDLIERLSMFCQGGPGHDWELKRCALNIDQVRKLKLPKNPAKSTDSRFADYKKQFGESSWELDALDPKALDKLVRANVEPLIDRSIWNAREKLIEETREKLRRVAKSFKG